LELPYNSAIPLLGIYPKECKSGYNKVSCIPMFIAGLLSIAKLWKKPRCPTTDENVVFPYIGILCSHKEE
jgi:hypothetical protein